MSGSDTTRRRLLREIEALMDALMGEAPPAEIMSIAGQLEAAVDHGGEDHGAVVPPAAITEVRSAIELVRSGQPCAAVSALLAARSELSTPPR